MPAPKEMPAYRCHKVVKALKIARILKSAHPNPAVDTSEFENTKAFQGAYLFPAEPGHEPIEVSPEWYRQHQPKEGGYYVRYEDGYASYSPAEAFESGYAPISGNPVPPAKTRLTTEDLEAAIVSEHYFTAAQGEAQALMQGAFTTNHTPPKPMPEDLQRLTFCVLVLRGGLVMTGESHVLNIADYSEQIGRESAREDAIRKVWPLLAYEKLTRSAANVGEIETIYL